MASVLRNLKPVARTILSDLKDSWQTSREARLQALNEIEKKAVADLQRDGLAIIRDYWPQSKALTVRDQLEKFLKKGCDEEFDCGAYLRFWDNRKVDQGVRRIYHIDKLVPELLSFRNDPMVFRIAAAYYGFPFYSGTMIFQHNVKTNENTRYYHVDDFGKEFKSFLYLDDVGEDNGPFTYLKGSHHSYWRRCKKQLFGNPPGESPTTFFANDVGGFLGREFKVLGPAGTLILADVRGFHRGSPQKSRSRSVLMNYMYRHNHEVYLDR